MYPDNRMEIDDWKEFERFIYDALKRQGLEVSRDVKIKGRSGTQHQIDVLARFSKAGLGFSIVIECKYLNRKVGLSIIKEINGLLDDVRAEKAVVVSRRGFTRGASRFASDKNIQLLPASSLFKDVDFRSRPIDSIPMGMLRNMIDPIDLLILAEMNEGSSESLIPEQVRKQTGVQISRAEVEDRVFSLQRKGVLLRRRASIIDPTKLYNHIYLVQIKARQDTVLKPSGLNAVFCKIMETSKKHGNIVRTLFGVLGLADYDFVAMAYANDQAEFHTFVEDLISEGAVERVWTSEIGTGGLSYFDPISLPNYMDYTNFLIHITEVLDHLIDRGNLRPPNR